MKTLLSYGLLLSLSALAAVALPACPPSGSSSNTDWATVSIEHAKYHSLQSRQLFANRKSGADYDVTFFPVSVAPGVDGTDCVGIRNGTSADVPAWFIGYVGPYAGVHLFEFENAPSGLYRITYHLVDPYAELKPAAAELDGIVVTKVANHPGSFIVECRTQRPDALLLIDVVRETPAPLALRSCEVDSIEIELLEAIPAFAQLRTLKVLPATWEPEILEPLATPPHSFDLQSSFEGIYTQGFAWSQETVESVFLHFNNEFSEYNLEKALIEIFGTDRPASDEETICLELLAYVTQKMYLAQPKINEVPWHSGSFWLKEGYGNCYNRSLALVSLCRKAGLPARVISIPGMDHVVAEAYYDGQWHAFDPSYGFFYYDRPCYDESGSIPSIQELRRTGIPGEYLYRVTQTMWTGLYDEKAHVVPVADDFRPSNNWPSDVEDWITYYKNGPVASFPCATPYYAGFTRFWPVHLDFAAGDNLQMGVIDRALWDCVPLGPAGHTNNINVLRFQNARPGRYTLTYQFFDTDYTHRPVAVEGRNVRLMSSVKYPGEMWQAKVEVLAEDAVLFVDLLHESDDFLEGAWPVDAIHVSRD